MVASHHSTVIENTSLPPIAFHYHSFKWERERPVFVLWIMNSNRFLLRALAQPGIHLLWSLGLLLISCVKINSHAQNAARGLVTEGRAPSLSAGSGSVALLLGLQLALQIRSASVLAMYHLYSVHLLYCSSHSDLPLCLSNLESKLFLNFWGAFQTWIPRHDWFEVGPSLISGSSLNAAEISYEELISWDFHLLGLEYCRNICSEFQHHWIQNCTPAYS